MAALWARSTLAAALSHRTALAGLPASADASRARATLCTALRQSGHPQRLAVLVAVLGEGDGQERAAAARELVLLRSSAAEPALLAALDHPAPEVRAAPCALSGNSAPWGRSSAWRASSTSAMGGSLPRRAMPSSSSESRAARCSCDPVPDRDRSVGRPAPGRGRTVRRLVKMG